MLPRYNLWGLCLLGGAAAEMSYLVARANTAVASESTTAFASISNLANLCGLAAPENTTSETDSSNTVTVTCSDCTTVSGVVVGTAVPSNLIPTDQTASFSDGANNKRAQLTAMPRETLMSRAPAALPLAEPDPNHQADFMMAIKESIPIDSLFNMQINPNVFQLHQWRIPLQINGKTVQTPVGVVSEFQRWPTNSAANYKMEEMSGCTGIFIVGNSGFYAVHFWESTRPDNVNGGSSFNYRYGTGKNDVMIRPLADFKAIAVDIFKQRSPSGAKNFLSLVDLREIHDDPFSEANGGGDVYIITRAAGPSKTQQTTQMYPSQIAALTSVIRRYIKVNSINIRTYIGDKTTFKGDPPVSPVGVPKDLNGVTILQYSPYAGKNSNGCPEARARIWEEVNTSPAVDRKWPSTMPGLNKRDGAACGLSSPTTSTSEPDC